MQMSIRYSQPHRPLQPQRDETHETHRLPLPSDSSQLKLSSVASETVNNGYQAMVAPHSARARARISELCVCKWPLHALARCEFSRLAFAKNSIIYNLRCRVGSLRSVQMNAAICDSLWIRLPIVREDGSDALEPVCLLDKFGMLHTKCKTFILQKMIESICVHLHTYAQIL